MPSSVRRAVALLAVAIAACAACGCGLLFAQGDPANPGCYAFPGCFDGVPGLSAGAQMLIVACVLALALVAVVRGLRWAREGFILAALVALGSWNASWDPRGALFGLGVALCWLGLAWYALTLTGLYASSGEPWFHRVRTDASPPVAAKAVWVVLWVIVGLVLAFCGLVTLIDLSSTDGTFRGLSALLVTRYVLTPVAAFGTLAVPIWRWMHPAGQPSAA